MVRRRRAIPTLRKTREVVPPAGNDVSQAKRDAAVLDEAAKIKKDSGRLNAAKKYRTTSDQSRGTEQVKDQ